MDLVESDLEVATPVYALGFDSISTLLTLAKAPLTRPARRRVAAMTPSRSAAGSAAIARSNNEAVSSYPAVGGQWSPWTPRAECARR